MTDKEIGLNVVKRFWYWHQTYFGKTNRLTFEEFQKKIPKFELVIDSIGGGVRSVNEDIEFLTQSRIDQAMRNLALKSNGSLPKDGQVFFKYLMNESVKVDWVDAIAYTTKETAKDVGSGLVEIGNSVLTTGKILNFLLPLILLGAVFFFLDGKSGGKLSGAFKK